jgi:nucleoside-diphosphate-sugar epimerase
METISLRYANVYGPRQDPEGAYAGVVPKFISLIEAGQAPTINGDGNQTRDFVYVGDVVKANLKAAVATHEHIFGDVFNIGSGVETSVNEIAHNLIGLSGKDMKPQYGPGLIEVRRSVVDITKAQDHLDWSPSVPLEEGLQKTYDFFK